MKTTKSISTFAGKKIKKEGLKKINGGSVWVTNHLNTTGWILSDGTVICMP